MSAQRMALKQPETFELSRTAIKEINKWIAKYPADRQRSALIPALWIAQKDADGWLPEPALRAVADKLGMAYIRVYEVASFYTMYNLSPVGEHFVQLCGTTPCWLRGSDDLKEVMRRRVGPQNTISSDGKLSWLEVECLGACANAPMVQIGKDFYEDLTADRFAEIIDEFAAGKVPTPGPQNGRFAAEPLGGLTALTEWEKDREDYNGSVARAVGIGDTVKRIQGDEVPILTPWLDSGKTAKAKKPATKKAAKKAAVAATDSKAKAKPAKAKAASKTPAKAAAVAAPAKEKKPRTMTAPRKAGADDLKLISGVGPKLEGVLNELGFYHFDQIAKWTEAEVAWVDSRLKFKGRIERDNWMDQASTLAAGGETAFSKKASK